MFLSNLGKSFLLAVLCVPIFQGCSSAGSSPDLPAPPVHESKSGYPFSTREPEVYEGDMIINGKDGERTHLARKGDRWLSDRYQGGVLAMTELKTDKMYSVDHIRRVYVEEPLNQGRIDSFAGMPFDVFKGKEFYEFDETGREGSTVRYKVRTNKYMPDDVLIDVDIVSGMIVRQEFKAANTSGDTASQPGFLYEMRNLKLEVDDGIFVLPTGYKKLTSEEFRASTNKKP